MMMCNKCKDSTGPFICEVKTGKCLCESCYMFDEAVKKCADLIKYRCNDKKNVNMIAVTLMDSIEVAVFDELGLN